MKIEVKANPAFKDVHQSTKRYIVMKGSAGSGKSVDTAQQYILRLMTQKGRNLLCVRKSEVTNRDSTFAELLSAINRLGVQAYWKKTLNPLQFKCVNGNSIIFRGVNDESQREKLKSITFATGKLTDVWIEEATELQQQDFEIIDDRLRGELSSGLFYQIKMTFNPVSKEHWIKKVFFDIKDDNVLTNHSTYLQNRYIDEAYRQRMERRKLIDPDGYRIYGLGDWGEVGGLILSNWNAEKISQDIDDYDAVTIGQDFGFNHANALLLLGYKDSDLYVLREIYVFNKDTAEIIDQADKERWPKDVHMYCDSAEADRIQMWRKAGYKARAVSKEKTKGKKYQATQIDWLKQRRIFIHPSCTNTIGEISQWKWYRDQATGEYTDEPVAFKDDAMAALRYGVEAWRKPHGMKVNILREGL